MLSFEHLSSTLRFSKVNFNAYKSRKLIRQPCKTHSTKKNRLRLIIWEVEHAAAGAVQESRYIRNTCFIKYLVQ
jgi:hypothetical protein